MPHTGAVLTTTIQRRHGDSKYCPSLTKKTILITEDISEPVDEGIKKFSFYLAKYVRESGEQNVVFSASTNSDVPNIQPLPTNKLLFSLRFFQRLYSANADQIVYIPFSSSTLMSFIRLFIISLFKRQAKIVMFSVQERKHSSLSRKVISLLKPDLLVVLSNKEAAYYKKLGFNCRVTPIGVEFNKYSQVTSEQKKMLRLKLNLPENEKIVLHVGHVNKGRNLEVLNHLQELGYKVVVVASTRFQTDLQLKSNLEAKGYLFVSHFIKDIQEYYQASDLYAFPVVSAVSAMEFPMSVLEAMSCNIPVITTRFGGIESFMDETDWFKYFSDGPDLVEKTKAFPNEGECTNRSLVLSKFSWQKVFDNLFSKMMSA